MRKIAFVLLGLFFMIFAGCNKNVAENVNVTGDEKTAQDYVQAQGYEIIEYKGQVVKYSLEKNKLYGGTKTIPYQQAWAVQQVEPDKYFGKEISVYGFKVKNHPLEKIYEGSKGATIFIMICEGKVAGGYSYPNADVTGAYYSIDGRTLGEVTGLTFKQWSDNWKKKYGD